MTQEITRCRIIYIIDKSANEIWKIVNRAIVFNKTFHFQQCSKKLCSTFLFTGQSSGTWKSIYKSEGIHCQETK